MQLDLVRTPLGLQEQDPDGPSTSETRIHQDIVVGCASQRRGIHGGQRNESSELSVVPDRPGQQHETQCEHDEQKSCETLSKGEEVLPRKKEDRKSTRLNSSHVK